MQSNGKRMLLAVVSLAMLACGCTGVTSNVTDITYVNGKNISGPVVVKYFFK